MSNEGNKQGVTRENNGWAMLNTAIRKISDEVVF